MQEAARILKRLAAVRIRHTFNVKRPFLQPTLEHGSPRLRNFESVPWLHQDTRSHWRHKDDFIERAIFSDLRSFDDSPQEQRWIRGCIDDLQLEGRTSMRCCGKLMNLDLEGSLLTPCQGEIACR